MLTSVVIPTYNRAHLVSRAVRSLLRQIDDVALDIVVIDDGSTDETPSLLADLAKSHTSVRVFRQDNAGVAAARNLGLRNLLPDTEVVSFLDSDDISPLGRFAADLAVLKDTPDVAYTYGRVLRVKGINEEKMAPSDDAITADVVMIQLSSGLYRRSLIDTVGFFDETMVQGEDTDFLFRIFELGLDFAATDTTAVYYVHSDNSLTVDQVTSKKMFAKAVLRSTHRRRANPQLTFKSPTFDHEDFMAKGRF